jgi:hypothetical protein
MNVLLIAPSCGLGGGIERYVSTVEAAFRSRDIASTRLSVTTPEFQPTTARKIAVTRSAWRVRATRRVTDACRPRSSRAHAGPPGPAPAARVRRVFGDRPRERGVVTPEPHVEVSPAAPRRPDRRGQQLHRGGPSHGSRPRSSFPLRCRPRGSPPCATHPARTPAPSRSSPSSGRTAGRAKGSGPPSTPSAGSTTHACGSRCAAVAACRRPCAPWSTPSRAVTSSSAPRTRSWPHGWPPPSSSSSRAGRPRDGLRPGRASASPSSRHRSPAFPSSLPLSVVAAMRSSPAHRARSCRRARGGLGGPVAASPRRPARPGRDGVRGVAVGTHALRSRGSRHPRRRRPAR